MKWHKLSSYIDNHKRSPFQEWLFRESRTFFPKLSGLDSECQRFILKNLLYPCRRVLQEDEDLIIVSYDRFE